MLETPRSIRLHIAIFGRRNAGKSSLINAVTGQQIALVSAMAGTTTDPVYKSMELLPLGPIVMIDTAGIDDAGEIGELRVKKTKEVMEKTDIALLVIAADEEDLSMEMEWAEELKRQNIPIIGVINKIDTGDRDHDALKKRFGFPFVKVSAKSGENILKLKEAIMINQPQNSERSSIIGDIVNPKDVVVLVMPQDIQAPKGRLILPQVQVIRDLLDHHVQVFSVTDEELENALTALKAPPDLIITDSQMFAKVNKIVPESVPLTSFSILMARYKGELGEFVEGAGMIDRLAPGDKVLIAEACTHHALKGDIGREKLPRWLEQKAGGPLNISVCVGADFPDQLQEYKLIVHCGACMFNRKQLLARLYRCKAEHVPITNYGTAIAHLNGILQRSVEMLS